MTRPPYDLHGNPMTAQPQPQVGLSSEEYLARERQAEVKSEYHDGEVFAMSSASRPHNLIVTNLVRERSLQLRDRDCEVYPSDMRVKVDPTGLYTYPDVAVVCGTSVFEDEQVDTLLNPTLLVEALSTSTEARNSNTTASWRRSGASCLWRRTRPTRNGSRGSRAGSGSSARRAAWTPHCTWRRLTRRRHWPISTIKYHSRTRRRRRNRWRTKRAALPAYCLRCSPAKTGEPHPRADRMLQRPGTALTRTSGSPPSARRTARRRRSICRPSSTRTGA